MRCYVSIPQTESWKIFWLYKEKRTLGENIWETLNSAGEAIGSAFPLVQVSSPLSDHRCHLLPVPSASHFLSLITLPLFELLGSSSLPVAQDPNVLVWFANLFRIWATNHVPTSPPMFSKPTLHPVHTGDLFFPDIPWTPIPFAHTISSAWNNMFMFISTDLFNPHSNTMGHKLLLAH